MPAIIGDPKTKGMILLARREFVETRWGAEGWEKVLERLSAEDQQVLRGLILAISWYPLELNIRLDQAIAAVHSPHDREQIFLEMGRASAEVNMLKLHPSYVKAGDPKHLLDNTGRIYESYYDSGYRTCEMLSETSAVLKTHEAQNVTSEDCLTVVGWYQKAIEICGGKDVKVRETKCRVDGAPYCEYLCEWS
jgi:uncharacterized protein (TIGR02265 family)